MKYLFGVLIILIYAEVSVSAEITVSDFHLLGNKPDIVTTTQQLKKDVENLERQFEQTQPQPQVRSTPNPPPTNGGPAWKYDPNTGSYYRYIPASAAVSRPAVVNVPIQQPPQVYQYNYDYVQPTPTYQYQYNYVPQQQYMYPQQQMLGIGGGGYEYGGGACVGGS